LCALRLLCATLCKCFFVRIASQAGFGLSGKTTVARSFTENHGATPRKCFYKKTNLCGLSAFFVQLCVNVFLSVLPARRVSGLSGKNTVARSFTENHGATPRKCFYKKTNLCGLSAFFVQLCVNVFLSVLPAKRDLV